MATRKRHVTFRSARGTRSRSRGTFAAFKRDITRTFFEILLTVKLYHWNTHSYATHKATDELYERLNKNTDRFMEVLLGKTAADGRIVMTPRTQLSLVDLDDPKELAQKIGQFKAFLVTLNVNAGLKSIGMDNSDLFTIRDEILADLNQFLYLLTLHG